MIKKLLLPIDGSRRGLRSVEMAKQVCDPAETEIVLVEVISARRGLSAEENVDANRAAAMPNLDEVEALLPEYKVTKQILAGSNPGVEIIDYARVNGVDTIIITRSSRGPLSKFGSVATYIVRNADFLNVIVLHAEKS